MSSTEFRPFHHRDCTLRPHKRYSLIRHQRQSMLCSFTRNAIKHQTIPRQCSLCPYYYFPPADNSTIKHVTVTGQFPSTSYQMQKVPWTVLSDRPNSPIKHAMISGLRRRDRTCVLKIPITLSATSDHQHGQAGNGSKHDQAHTTFRLSLTSYLLEAQNTEDGVLTPTINTIDVKHTDSKAAASLSSYEKHTCPRTACFDRSRATTTRGRKVLKDSTSSDEASLCWRR